MACRSRQGKSRLPLFFLSVSRYQQTQCARVSASAVTPIFWGNFLAFPVFLARLAGEEPSAGAGKMKTRETFTGGSRHPKKIICVVIWSPEVCLITGSSKGAFIWEPKAPGRGGIWHCQRAGGGGTAKEVPWSHSCFGEIHYLNYFSLSLRSLGAAWEEGN